MPNFENNGVTIQYEDKGEGIPLLLIHGHTLDHRVFSPLVEPWIDQGFRMIMPDLRGHGRSSRPSCGYHWSHHAADIAGVLTEAGIDRATVVGFSVGGGIALEMALTIPERVKNLALMAPVMPDRRFEAEFMANLKEVAAVIRKDGVASAMEGPWMESPLFAKSLLKPGITEQLREIVKDFSGAEYLATSRDTVERDWKTPDRLAEISIPALVLVGALEMPGFRAFADEAAAGIPGARLEIIEGCGHLLPLEATAEVATLIETFVKNA